MKLSIVWCKPCAFNQRKCEVQPALSSVCSYCTICHFLKPYLCFCLRSLEQMANIKLNRATTNHLMSTQLLPLSVRVSIPGAAVFKGQRERRRWGEGARKAKRHHSPSCPEPRSHPCRTAGTWLEGNERAEIPWWLRHSQIISISPTFVLGLSPDDHRVKEVEHATSGLLHGDQLREISLVSACQYILRH